MALTSDRQSALWSRGRGWCTSLLVLSVTLIAFEGLGTGTVMPLALSELDGERSYAWPFIAFVAASVVATVWSGALADRRGPKPALATGMILFLLGLIVAATSESVLVLVLGRALQGFGGGVQVVTGYVVIAAVYPERDRPAVFGLIAAAWVLPASAGPALAGWLAEQFSWRMAFAGLVPLALAELVLLVPVFRALPRHEDSGGAARKRLLLSAVVVAASAAAFGWAAQHAVWWLMAAAIVVMPPALAVLLPEGTLRARRGLPSVVLSRGLLSGSYFAVGAFIPLMLTVVHGLSPLRAGLPLTFGELGYVAASVALARRPALPRGPLVRHGFVLIAIGMGVGACAAANWGPVWLMAVAWLVAGTGMGLGLPSIGVLTLAASGPRDRGFNSAALQISDMTGSVLCVGIGGGLVVAAGPAAGVVLLNAGMAALAVVGAVVTGPRISLHSGLSDEVRSGR